MYVSKDAPDINSAVNRAIAKNEASSPDTQPPVEVIIKRVVAVAVGICAVLPPMLPQVPWLDTACRVVIGVGAALGITSRGVLPK